MARTGIYFSDVKRARDEVIANGRKPSIDAVRAALGDTGSKTTIHKYLREIEKEEGDSQRDASETILVLVAQLADQLKQEANSELDEARSRMSAQRAVEEQARANLETQLVTAQKAISDISQRLELRDQDVVVLQDQLIAERMARQVADQQVADLILRLTDVQSHKASLEEKHMHARDALDHFRTASKEQREQEQRRHEHQVQGLQAELKQERVAVTVKHEELARLNREAAALAAELRGAKQNLHLERETNRSLMKKIEEQHGIEERSSLLEIQLAESRVRLTKAEEDLTLARRAGDELRHQKSSLEAALSQVAVSTAVEERLAKLDKAVFGDHNGRSRPQE